MAEGSDHRWAAMCAMNTAPGSIRTDKAYQQHARREMSEMPEGQQKLLQEIAKDAGINTTGKHYEGALGRYSDPAAWVSNLDDVAASCKAKGIDMDGAVRIRGNKRVDEAPAPRPKLAPHLVEEAVNNMASHPDVAAKIKAKPTYRQELREVAIESCSPSF